MSEDLLDSLAPPPPPPAAAASASSSSTSASAPRRKTPATNAKGKGGGRAVPRLSSLCMDVVSAKLERYPPSSLGVLSEAEWECIVRRRHRKTAPSANRGGAPTSGGGGGGDGGGGDGKGGGGGSGGVAVLAVGKPPPSKGGLDGSGRMAPAICDKTMRLIESKCPHLSESKAADELVWKDCVEYRYRTGGPSRPAALRYPWDVLVGRLKKCGEELMGLLREPPKPKPKPRAKKEVPTKQKESLSEDKGPSSTLLFGSDEEEEDDNDEDGGGGEGGNVEEEEECNADQVDPAVLRCRYRSLDRALRTLSDAPMSVPLLTACGLGKTVSKFIKACHRLEGEAPQWVVDVWNPRALPADPNSPGGRQSPATGRGGGGEHPSPLERLENLLQVWKNVASSSGVAMAGKRSRSYDSSDGGVGGSDSTPGKDKRTSDEQHRRDMDRLRRCAQWRHLHEALADREAEMMASRGAKMRKIRENLESNRHKVGRLHTKLQGCADKRARQEAILSGSRGARVAAMNMRGAGSAAPASKVGQMRAEVSNRQVGARNTPKPAAASFGYSIANNKSRTQAALGGMARNRQPSDGGASSGFGASVAMASLSKPASKRKAGATLNMGGGKRLKLPKSSAAAAVNSLQAQRQRANVKKMRQAGRR